MKRISLLICFAALCLAQPAPVVEGEVLAENGADLSHLTVKLEDPQRLERSIVAGVSLHGEFRLYGAPDGLYMLRVLNEHGDEIVSDIVSIAGMTHQRLSIRLVWPGAARPRGPASLAQLAHRPDRRALQTALKAQKFAEEGRRGEALSEWSKAVEIDPRYTDGWNNLGVAYLRTRRPDDAIPALETAISLDKGCARCYSNLAVALYQVHRLEEAESSARRGVQLDPESEPGRYILERVLAARAASQ